MYFIIIPISKSGCTPAATIADVQAVAATAAAAVVCVYGLIEPDRYLPGDASAAGKMFPSIAGQFSMEES